MKHLRVGTAYIKLPPAILNDEGRIPGYIDVISHECRRPLDENRQIGGIHCQLLSLACTGIVALKILRDPERIERGHRRLTGWQWIRQSPLYVHRMTANRQRTVIDKCIEYIVRIRDQV